MLNLQLVNNIIDGRLVCVPLGGGGGCLSKLDWITCRGYFQRLASGLKMLRDTKLLSGLGRWGKSTELERELSGQEREREEEEEERRCVGGLLGVG